MLAQSSLRSIITPLVRLLVRRGVTFPAFSKAAKEAFINVAHDELVRTGGKLSDSRLAAITGLHRSEISRWQNRKTDSQEYDESLLVKVIGTWEHDRRFSTSRGKARVLSFGFEDSDFSNLVRSVHSHLHASTILAELERCGVAEETSDGIVLKRSALPLDQNPSGALEFFSKDMETLGETVEFNITHPHAEKRLHIRTEFDNIIPEKLAEIQAWVLEQGRAFHRKMREHLSQYDRDLTSSEQTDLNMRGRVVVTAFAHVESEQKKN